MLPGDRVVIRYRLEPGAPADWRNADGATLSDVTGYVTDDGDPVVVVRDGTPVEVPAHLIESVRVLSHVTVRNSAIREAEVAHARSAPGTESAVIDGWLVRAGNPDEWGNAAVPLDLSAGPGGLALVREWFVARSVQPWAAIATRLFPMPTPDATVEVLTDGTTWLRVPKTDREARITARRNGFTLHHEVGYHRL